MATKPFKVQKFDRYDKRIEVEGPEYLLFYVDFDDVDQTQVRRDLRKAVRILNEHWDD